MKEKLLELDSIRLNFSTDGLIVLNIVLALIMFGVALEIKLNDFKQLLKSTKSLFTGIISQFIILPMLTTIIVLALQDVITPSIALGMILVACCPGGNISNFICNLAKGNTALSVSLTAFSTVSAILITPLNFSLWGGIFSHFYNSGSVELVRPLVIDSGEMFKTVLLLLGIPLTLGMFMAHKLPKITQKIIKPFKVISIIAFLGMIAISFVKNYEHFANYIHFIFFIVLLHNLVAYLSGNLFARTMRLREKEQKTITIETGIQNSGLALALLFNPNIFPEGTAVGGMAFIAAWWGIWHIVSGLTLAGFWSKARKRKLTKITFARKNRFQGFSA